jgi:pimeloyl-ACP methyl ester carboxylesterase
MDSYIPWNSQSLEKWSNRYARGEFIELNGRSTHYLERGDGEPVILIHGFNMDIHTWSQNINDLAEQYRVLAIDLWGQGFSTREPLDYGYALYAEQIRRFMDALDIQKVNLVGHSMGGGTAIYFAVRFPERVNSLVLVDSTGIPNPLPLRSKFFTLPGVGEFLMSINNNYFRRKNLGDIWFHDRDLLTEKVFEDLMQFHKVRGTSEVLLKILRKQFFHTLSDEIGQLDLLNIPTMVVWGRNDVSIPVGVGQEMHERISGSRFEVIENGGHMPNWESPDHFNRAVLGFLSETLTRDEYQVELAEVG